MDTRTFLEAVWPSHGIYCLATPFKPGDDDRSTFSHHTYTSIDAFVAAVESAPKNNVFFCVHTLKEAKVWNPQKRDRKTGTLGAFERRTHTNMREAKCFFFDLDVGESTAVTPKYKTRQEALDGLDQFLFRTGLPDPLVTSSGGGYHVYWRLSEAIESVEWRRQATILRHVAAREGLKADPARTNDQASVLRVVGTTNVKPGHDPRPCVALTEGVETSTGSFLGQLGELLGSDVVATQALSVPAHARTGNIQKVWDGRTPTLEEVSGVCEHVRTYVAEGLYARGEPVLYHLGCGVIAYVEDGYDHYEDFAQTHPDYADLGRVRAKFDQYVEQTDGMPSSCTTIDAKCGGTVCQRCPNAKLGKNPLLIANEAQKRAALPPPVPQMSLAAQQPTVIVEPPAPYKRSPAGITRKAFKTDKDGNESEIVEVLVPYDIFPFEMCGRTELERAFSMWAVSIPNEPQKVIKLTSAMLSDLRALAAELNDQGVYVPGKHIPKVAEMMQHWLRSLQAQTAASRQYDHLGWADPEHTQFILPTTVLKTDGTQVPCTVSGMVKEVARGIRTAGTLADQIRLLKYYSDDKYFRHQFVVLCALAAPAFHSTDFYGVVVNAAGESGGGKSSALYAGASLWGHPTEYVVNGTQTGMTLLAQQHRVFTLANLPVCVDEITTQEDPFIRDFCIGSTQKSERGRLDPAGTPKPVRETYKSTIYLVSSNKSFHNLLGQGSEVGNASSMRVFEMWFPEFTSGKVEAQEFMHSLQVCHGWIGPAALERYLKHREYVDNHIRKAMAVMDRKCSFTGPERYWSAVIAVVLVYAEFAQSFGLIPFDLKRLRDWLLDEQVPLLRGAIASDNKSHDSSSLLSSFLNDRQGQTLVTNCDLTMNTQLPIDVPRGSIVAEYDKSARKIYVRKDSFRGWLKERNYNAIRAFTDLIRDGQIVAMDVKRTIGAGTDYARGRSLCFEVDTTHPDFSETKPTQAPASNVVPLRKRT